MSETPKAQNQEAFNAFVKQYNLDPLNKDAINNCLFDLLSMIMEMAKNTYAERHVDKPEEFHTMTLFDKWNK